MTNKVNAMRNSIFLIFGAILGLCTLPLSGGSIYVVNSASRTLSHIDTETGGTDNSFAQLGLTPNLMDMDDEYIYIACSGDNAIQIISRDTGDHIRYIPVAASSNPWDVVKADGHLYASGLFTNKVYKISLQTNAVAGILQVGEAPEGMAAGGGRLYVCNTGGYANNYANSSISVIDLETFALIETIPVWTNPQYAVLHEGRLHVSCTGNWTNVDGRIDVIDIETLELEARLDIGGNPGCLWIGDDGIAIVGDGMGNAAFSYDANTLQIIHSEANPLSLSAFAISGANGQIAMLEQNWSGNSLVRLFNGSLEPLGEFTVGMSSTDLIYAPGTGSSAQDETAQSMISVYPNPLASNGILSVNSRVGVPGNFSLYNLRGQKVMQAEITGSKDELAVGRLPGGIYLYRIGSGKSVVCGKLLVMD